MRVFATVEPYHGIVVCGGTLGTNTLPHGVGQTAGQALDNFMLLNSDKVRELGLTVNIGKQKELHHASDSEGRIDNPVGVSPEAEA